VIDDTTFLLDSASRLAAPLLFVALGELLAERAGALNISVEAAMLGSAYGAALGSSVTDSSVLGFAIGVACGVLVALVQALLSHRLTVNQFVVGLTLNILVLGLTSYLFSSVGMTPQQFGILRIPLLSDIPLVGEALFAQRWPFFAIYVLIPLAWWLLYRTRWGLELQAVGENPQAADVSGVPVNRRRRQAILFGGVCAGFGGAYLAVGAIGSFSPNMTAGRGFVAIAALIFGGWTVRGTVLGCLLFGFMDALRLALPAIGFQLNTQLLISAPYLMAILAMLFFARRQRQPAALAQGFQRRAL
jgi:ABC-type uncharacterized transport system permease subunit